MSTNSCPITTEYAILREQYAEIEEIIRQRCAEEYQLLEDIRTRINELREPAKDELRQSGLQKFTYGNFEATIKRPPTKTTVDTSALVRMATEQRDLVTLLQHKVLSYEVNATQIQRLPDVLKDRYTKFVQTTEGTAAVSLP